MVKKGQDRSLSVRRSFHLKYCVCMMGRSLLHFCCCPELFYSADSSLSVQECSTQSNSITNGKKKKKSGTTSFVKINWGSVCSGHEIGRTRAICYHKVEQMQMGRTAKFLQLYNIVVAMLIFLLFDEESTPAVQRQSYSSSLFVSFLLPWTDGLIFSSLVTNLVAKQASLFLADKYCSSLL